MELKGKIVVIEEVKQVSDSFKVRNLVVETQEQYPQFIQVQFTQDKCDVLNAYEIGDSVTIGINLKGRKWTDKQGVDKYFNTIEGWKISKEENSSNQEFDDDLAF